jgi:hypothetical protein
LATTISLCAIGVGGNATIGTLILESDTGETFLVRLEESRMIEERCDEQSLPEWQFDPLGSTREVLQKRRCFRLPSWFEVHEGRIMERFAEVQWIHPFGKCCRGAIHHSGEAPPAPGCDLLAGGLRIPGIVLNNSVGRNRA